MCTGTRNARGLTKPCVFPNEVTPASPKALPFTTCSPNCAASCLWGPELDSRGLEPAATTVKENAPETGHRVLVDGVLSDVPALWPAFSKATHVTSRSERGHQEATPEHDGNQGKCPGPQNLPDETPGPEQQAVSSWPSHPATSHPCPQKFGPSMRQDMAGRWTGRSFHVNTLGTLRELGPTRGTGLSFKRRTKRAEAPWHLPQQ